MQPRDRASTSPEQEIPEKHFDLPFREEALVLRVRRLHLSHRSGAADRDRLDLRTPPALTDHSSPMSERTPSSRSSSCDRQRASAERPTATPATERQDDQPRRRGRTFRSLSSSFRRKGADPAVTGRPSRTSPTTATSVTASTSAEGPSHRTGETTRARARRCRIDRAPRALRSKVRRRGSASTPASTTTSRYSSTTRRRVSDTLAQIPYQRRLLLIPKCLRDRRPKCPAPFDEFGLLCKECGLCSIQDLVAAEAERLGYAVLVAEGSAIVTALIETGQVRGRSSASAA